MPLAKPTHPLDKPTQLSIGYTSLVSLHILGTFFVAAVILVVVPGPTIAFIASTTIGRGRRAGLSAAIGIELATLTHGVIAAFGLSAIIASNQIALTVIRLAGAAYLAWLGISTLSKEPSELATEPEKESSFRDGYLVSLLNPKVILFFLTFIPQFIDPTGGWPIWGQIILMSLIIVCVGIINSAVWVFGIGTLLRGKNSKATRFVRRYVIGSVYLALAIFAAVGNIG